MTAISPSVCVVLPTRNRPVLLARAVRGILEQKYDGDLAVLIVVDQDEIATAVAGLPEDPRIQVVSNTRKPGLSGTRNTGILLATSDLIAFCDDDDEWLPGKLAAQVAALARQPESEFASCSVEVDFEGSRSVRVAGQSLVTHADLLRSRLFMLHSSTFMMRRIPFVEGIGLIAEDAPGSQNEDWDLLLRASARAPIAHCDQPLVRIYWTARSYFNREWDTKISSLFWMLEQHPDIETSAVGVARVYSQIGFGYAASKQRRDAWTWTRRALGRNWKEPRAYLTMLAIAGVSADWILQTLHKSGRGV